jgi:nucleotide-binding universal stress UspA family protein
MRVLIATDGSKYGKWAIETVAHLPLAERPVVQVLHVVDIRGLRAPFMLQPAVIGTERYLKTEIGRMQARAKRTKQEAAGLMKALGLKGRVAVERGSVAQTIVKAAKRGIGLVAVGSRGLDALDRFMLGSVSSHTIHHVPCPVLVVRDAPRVIRRVVLAVDGSPPSKKALQFILRSMKPSQEFAKTGRLIVTVSHVMPFLNYPELKEAGKGLVQEYMTKLARAGYVVEPALRVGNPANEILKIAESAKADLIMTGAQGLGAVGRWLLGSVSTRIVQHASSSVLVVR